MFKKKNTDHQGEIYPGGRQNLPSGNPPPPQGRQPKMYVQTFGIRIKGRPSFRITQNMVEKFFMVIFFIVLEIMIGWVFFHVLDNTFDSSNFPDDIRSFLKLVQLAMFIIFTYVNIMAVFFKVNLFD